MIIVRLIAVLSHVYQMLLQQIAQRVHQLITEEADQQLELVAGIHLVHYEASPLCGVETHIQHRPELAHVPFGFALAQVRPQYIRLAVPKRIQTDDDVDGVAADRLGVPAPSAPRACFVDSSRA